MIVFDYKLNSGSSIQRCFYVPIETVDKELLAIYKSNERYEQIKDELNITSDMFRFAEAEYQRDSNSIYRISYMTKTDCQNLLDAYWKDVQILNNMSFLSDESTRNLSVDVERYDNEYNYISFEIGNTFNNTLDYMSEMGYHVF